MSHSDQESSSIAEATNPPTADAAMMIMACDERDDTQVTCDVLCSLGAASSYSHDMPSNAYMMDDGTDSSYGEKQGQGRGKGTACPKQHQLPMFLSKTYHMIDRCDPTIATWSAAGDNFVVKNVEKFATDVLPLYFKHSNFSSFARQLNFYGFRKLRTDPILTSDVDPRTACYVRFYHEKFQKDRPELLHQIKRATKSDQQSKDDVDSLKHEVTKLRDCLAQMSSEMDRKMAEMSYEYNRRITTLSAEYDKLAALVTQILARGQLPDGLYATTTDADNNANRGVPDLMHSLSQVAAISLHNQLRGLPLTTTATTQGVAAAASSPGVMGSASPCPLGAVAAAAAMFGAKRPSPDEEANSGTTNRPRTG